MNDAHSHPVAGACIVIFFSSMGVLTLCATLLDLNLWLFFRVLLSLLLTASGGLILALWMRLRQLENQVRHLQEQLYKLEKD